MTKEELIKKIDAKIAKLSDNASQMCEEYEGYRLACKDISDVFHEIAKEIQPSLPSNLDEAAKECAIREGYLAGLHHEIMKRVFKAGAKWDAGQGVTVKGLLYGGNLGIPDIPEEFYTDKVEEVIVQIRKK